MAALKSISMKHKNLSFLPVGFALTVPGKRKASYHNDAGKFTEAGMHVEDNMW